jgi:hypothetical protein
MISKRILENASPLSHDPSDDSTQKRCFLALKMMLLHLRVYTPFVMWKERVRNIFPRD